MTNKSQLFPTKIGFVMHSSPPEKLNSIWKQLKHTSAATINDEDALLAAEFPRRVFFGIFEKSPEKLAECK